VSRSFQVFLAEPLDVGSVLEGLGWDRVAETEESFSGYGLDQFHLEGRDWFADIWGPSPMSWEDAPPEAVALLAGISWHVEISLEEGSAAGLNKVMRAVRTVAKAGRGVIADETTVWRPGSTRRTRWSIPVSPLKSEAERLTMIWWTLDPSVYTPAGATAFVQTLDQVLSEAVPVRWGDFEPLPFSLERDGLTGLAEYIVRAVNQLVLTKVRPPFSELVIHRASFLQLGRGPVVPVALRIEVGGSILNQLGWGRELAVAFEEISRLLRPFYAEARLVPNREWVERPGGEVDWTASRDSDVGPPPVSDWDWNGFPRVAPMAMVIGPPYTAYWDVGGGTLLDGLIFYSGESWPQPPPGGVPVAAEGLLQEFDPYSVWTDRSLSGAHPQRPPSIWPFDLPSEQEQIQAMRAQLRQHRLDVEHNRALLMGDGPRLPEAFTDFLEVREQNVSHALGDQTDLTLCGKSRANMSLQNRAFKPFDHPGVCPTCRELAKRSSDRGTG